MVDRALYNEVTGRDARRCQLGTDTGVPGIQDPIRQRRVIVADGIVERRRPRIVERVVDVVDPGDIWAESRASARSKVTWTPRPPATATG